MVDIHQQVLSLRKEVQTDSYPMSIGEVINLYRDGDLILRPEYQRLFRWSQEEKSFFIESLLLGLPIPTIFVEQDTESSKWAIVDGLQRISTVLQFVGVLKDKDGQLMDPLRLDSLERMDFLNGKSYEEFDEPTVRLFKREKLYISSIKAGSSTEAKYELFIRLNRTGQRLTNQEIRNAILTRENRSLYDFLQELKSNSDFSEVTNISESQSGDETDTEFIVRFLALKNLNEADVRKYKSLNSLFDDYVLGKIDQLNLDYDQERTIFNRSFSALKQLDNGSGRSLRRFQNNRYTGKVTISSFSVLAVGLGRYLTHYPEDEIQSEWLQEKIEQYWKNPIDSSRMSSYELASNSIARGKELFGLT